MPRRGAYAAAIRQHFGVRREGNVPALPSKPLLVNVSGYGHVELGRRLYNLADPKDRTVVSDVEATALIEAGFNAFWQMTK